jgi:hypothetical protein
MRPADFHRRDFALFHTAYRHSDVRIPRGRYQRGLHFLVLDKHFKLFNCVF